MTTGTTLDWRDIEHTAAVYLAIIHVGLGSSIIAGGASRFPKPTYSALLDATNDRAWPYGLFFIFTGLVLIINHPRAIFIGHCLGIVFLNAFAALFFIAMIRSPTAASTAWWAYFSLGTIHGFNIALMAVQRRRYQYPESEKGQGGGD